MTTILYSDREGGLWQRIDLDLTKEEIIKACLDSAKSVEDSTNKVRIISNHVIDAAAIMFDDGKLWDCILSDWDNSNTLDNFNCIMDLLKRRSSHEQR